MFDLQPDPDVHVEPHKKQLHVTLAYHFQASHLPALEKLAKNVDASSGCDWLAVLLSRDIRFANHEVNFTCLSYFSLQSVFIFLLLNPLLMSVFHLLSLDPASHVPVCASER